MTSKIRIILILTVFTHVSTYAQVSEAAARDTYNWQDFDSRASTVKKDALNFHMIQGVWYAYEGWYYGDEEKFWKDYNNPRVFQVQGNRFRASAYGPFVTYRMYGNLLTYPRGETIDSAYINLITDTKLIISFKRGEDFEKFIFQK